MDDLRALLLEGDPAQQAAAVDRLHRLGREGSAEAETTLAGLRASGFWMERNWDVALGHLRRAAELGSDAAERQLALLEGAGSRAANDVAALFSVPPRIPVCERPRIRRSDGFMTTEQCDWIVALAKGRLQRATTRTGYAGAGAVTPGRTNSAFDFTPFDIDCVVALLRERIAALLNMPVAAMEPPQLLHYAPGQSFAPHVDTLPPADQMSGDRIATFLVYLNDGFDGGETWFLKPGLKLKPGKGGALYFANVDTAGRPDPDTVHAGVAPVGGEKWLFSQWIRDRTYRG